METYTLSRPIKYDGQEITELNLDLEGLSAAALEAAEKQARALMGKKEIMTVPETNKKYLSCVAAKAAGVRADLIRNLGGKDYTQVCLLVQNFLLDGDSDSEESLEGETPENTETPTMTTQPEKAEPASTEFQTDYPN